MSVDNQVKKNLVFNILNLFINIIIGLVYTPFLIKSLGLLAYGIIPLALTISQYIGVLSSSLTGTLTRFYSVSKEEKNFQKSSEYLTSSLFVIVFLIIIISLISVFLVFNLDSLLNIPLKYLEDAKILFSYVLLSFIFSLFSSFFSITLYANNRLDFLNIINLSRNFTRVFLVFIFFETLSVKLEWVGLGSLIAEIIVLFLSFNFFLKTKGKEVYIHLKYYKTKVLMPILFMSFWVIVHQLGDIGIFRSDLIIINKFWTAKESGIIGAFSDLCSYILVLAGVITSLFGPIILILFSQKNHEKIKEMVYENSYFIGILMSVLIGLLIGFSEKFIKIWAGDELSIRHLWFIFKLISIPFFASAGVFAFVYRSWNRVKLPALVTLFLGILNVLVDYIIATFANGNVDYINYILIFSSFISIVQTYLLGIFMLKRIYTDITLFHFLMRTAKIVLSLILVSVISYCIQVNLEIDNWLLLIAYLSLSGLFSGSIVYSLLLNAMQKKNLLKLILKKHI